ncbi:MAG: hypothetical protein H8D34_04565 [Chloroflexi bacterium]|nr:hypothetical protein [Chloroflexota bacterium]MBL6965739.1 hypothetical protein [Anaerolineales bacterium]
MFNLKPEKFKKPLIIFSLVIFILSSSFAYFTAIPLTGHDGDLSESVSHVPNSEEFISAVGNGISGEIRGVYVPGVFALRVQQQPGNDANYVSSVVGAATQFEHAAQYGVTGFLAHNYLSGSLFFDLEVDHEVLVVYGDGSTKRYMVREVQQYQALQPNSPYSDFVDLDTNQKLSSGDLFNRVYAGEDHVTFQTCIAEDGNLTWGRLFVIATPVEEL